MQRFLFHAGEAKTAIVDGEALPLLATAAQIAALRSLVLASDRKSEALPDSKHGKQGGEQVRTAEEVRRYEYESPSEPIQFTTDYFAKRHETVQARRRECEPPVPLPAPAAGPLMQRDLCRTCRHQGPPAEGSGRGRSPRAPGGIPASSQPAGSQQAASSHDKL